MTRRLYLAVDVHNDDLADPRRTITEVLSGIFEALAAGPDMDRRAVLVAGSWDSISNAVAAGMWRSTETPAPLHVLDVQVAALKASHYNADNPRVEACEVSYDATEERPPTIVQGGSEIAWWHPAGSPLPAPPFGTRLRVEIHPHYEGS